MLMDTHDTQRIGCVNTKSIRHVSESPVTFRLTMGTGNKRLRSLRIAAGFKSAGAFAKHHKLTESTYRSHENGARDITLAAAKQYGKIHGKPWQFFLPDDALTKFNEDSDGLSDDDGIVNVPSRLYGNERSGITIFPEYDVRVAAGAGFYVDKERVKGEWPFPTAYIEGELRVTGKNLVVLEVVGDSMRPTLESGDRVLVNMNDTRVSQPGVFVLWDGDGTVVKRLELIPGSEPVRIRRISDNPLHGTYEVPLADTRVIGRAVWFGRRM